MAEQRKIKVITGGRGAGKTTWCRQAAAQAEQAGKIVAGVLCPADYRDGKKIAFFAQNLADHMQKLAGSGDPDVHLGESFYRWSLDPAVFAWVNQFLAEIQTCDLLIIDELGPLEFSENRGFSAAFDCLRTAHYAQALVVIRPECIDAFRVKGFDFEVQEIA